MWLDALHLLTKITLHPRTRQFPKRLYRAGLTPGDRVASEAILDGNSLAGDDDPLPATANSVLSGERSFHLEGRPSLRSTGTWPDTRFFRCALTRRAQGQRG